MPVVFCQTLRSLMKAPNQEPETTPEAVIADLRSDTVTQPTPDMREALMAAELGDDVLGDDPTVERLQQRAAELLGTEAALFTPSGTMANQLAIRAHTSPGDEVICHRDSHAFYYESGGPAALSPIRVCGPATRRSSAVN